MATRTEKKKFFDDTGKNAQGLSASEVLARSKGTGFSVDVNTGLVSVGDGPQAQRYNQYMARRNEAEIPGTAAGRQWISERRRLAIYMVNNGEYFTRPTENGGTELCWRQFNRKKHIVVARSNEPDLRTSDFRGHDYTYSTGVSRPVYDMLVDDFARYYTLLMGQRSITSPTMQEQTALDYRDELIEAAGIMRNEGSDNKEDD